MSVAPSKRSKRRRRTETSSPDEAAPAEAIATEERGADGQGSAPTEASNEGRSNDGPVDESPGFAAAAEGRTGRVAAAYERLLGKGVDARAVAVFRIVLAFSAWFEARETVKRIPQYTPGQYHMPYFGLDYALDYDLLRQLCEWQMRFALLLAVGLFGRFAALGVFVCQAAEFFVSQLNFRNHIFLTLILVALAATIRVDAAWSVSRLFQRLRGVAPTLRVPALGVRMIQAQILIVYFYTGFHKAALGFLTGFPLCRYLGIDVRGSRLARWLGDDFNVWVTDNLSRAACEARVPTIIVIGAIGTVIVELFMSVGLAFRKLVPLAIVLGVGLHASIFLSMNVVTFGLLMVATYPLFLTDPPADAVLGRGRR